MHNFGEKRLKMVFLRKSYNIVTVMCLSALSIYNSYAQKSQILSESIKTLQVQKNGEWMELPVLRLGSDDFISISFDEMSHQYHRFVYNIRHCMADWSESELLESEYMDGFNGQPVNDYKTSVNTTFQYTHYTLNLPNDDVNFLVSGNYEVTITDEDDGTEMVRARFAIIEDGAFVSASVSGNTDIDTNEHNQQLSINVNFSKLPVSDPEREIIVMATQNRRSDLMKTGMRPTHITPSQMQFNHCRELIFPGGNEYRRFEIVNMYDYTQNVDRIDFFDPYFHAILFPDERRREYRYDQDHNGRYLIRYSQAADSDTEADYLLVHFTLKIPKIRDGKVFIDGDFTNDVFCDKWEMEYNDRTNCYEKTAVLKMGSYDYRYVVLPEGGRTGITSPTEGDSYETVNEYQVYVWFRQRGSRYDRLTGLSDLRMAR